MLRRLFLAAVGSLSFVRPEQKFKYVVTCVDETTAQQSTPHPYPPDFRIIGTSGSLLPNGHWLVQLHLSDETREPHELATLTNSQILTFSRSPQFARSVCLAARNK